jgi:hypothetical protein
MTSTAHLGTMIHLPVSMMEASPLAYAPGNGQVRRYSPVTVWPGVCLTRSEETHHEHE